ncbi:MULTISPECIES: hypothetical protein [Thermus]|jgi:hypothetical protein|uniref:Uncharacterized protein n=1 Tax=Thermus brockianus TaxID=56956 RepID=A0A1J0LRR9_THEBO|nr:hypothetical protein [Thermus brockianus]APD09006.1 hypothetical protein A0O31_00830 [Thermus brockianus]BDG15561.1 hypothetical protein TbrSNM41_02950 [Thermus brockianus]
MRWLFLLPWLLFLLGLLPLAQGEALGQVEKGLSLFVAALLLAAVASLYSRFPVGFRVQLALVLGLGFLALTLALESALAFTGREGSFYTAMAGVLGAAALGAAFFLGTGREAPLLPALEGVGTREDLLRLAGALEGLALRRELILVYLAAPLPPERLAKELRRGDLAFLLEGGYLLVLQGSRPEDAAGLIRRLKERFPLAAYAVERWRGGSLERVLARLEAETLLQT